VKAQLSVGLVQAEAFVGTSAGQSDCETQLKAPSVQAQVVSAIPPPPMGSPATSYRQVRLAGRVHSVAAAGTMAGQGVSQLQPLVTEQVHSRSPKAHSMPLKVQASALAGALAGQSELA
jgi:hypothetical protein